MNREPTGKVYLVGAGPGDPGLLTLKGKRCLERAEVIVYDYLANDRLLDHAPPDAERIYVGRREDEHRLAQEEINRLVIERARRGQVVVRLKGGDPFIFGRGGEEAEALVEAGIPYEVVPGVTSAISVPAYAGIPLTHRDLTSSVAFVAGRPAREGPGIDWRALAGMGTVVFLMGVSRLPEIVARLVEQGRAPETPVAVIRLGTWPLQQTVMGTLRDIVQRAQAVRPPAVIVVGEVVWLRDRLRWYEEKPLFGRRIVVTRAREQQGDFADLLEGYGAEVIECPTIAILPPEDWRPLDQGLERIGSYHWVVFTSANGVRRFIGRLRERGGDLRDLHGVRVAAIGPATAAALQEAGLRPDLVPDEYRAEAILKTLDGDLTGVRFLIPRAAKAREVLPAGLRERGAQVEVVPAYRTVRVADRTGAVLDRLRAGQVDAVTFTSSSTVVSFVDMFRGEDLPALLKDVVVACIGPITAETAAHYGLVVDLVPSAFTVPSLAEALVGHFGHRTPPRRPETDVAS
ncbi:MAG: uroporphyrinogen-III C-methyltransferase [Candidatus Methylomirabilales bacterium]